ncbi:nitroreductase family protein [Cyanobium gracile UHCC 0281]|uniref:Nitroreductase family protein n=2 Tax=Cyanobium gracile TaxID=59930 RepID=A0ABU5SW65_9CYAN|nr:nitroreductase family protein [Cyanobium gracile UHCC 0281]
MEAYDDAVAVMRRRPSAAPEIRDLIRYATLAANGHNTQAWLFRPDEDGITILPDVQRRTPVVDPDDHHLYVSMGCAAENLAIAAGTAGRAGAIDVHPAGDGGVRFRFGTGNGNDQSLFEAIPQRQSTRADYDGSRVEASDLRQLRAAAAIPGVDLVLVSERTQLNQLRDLILAANTVQMGDPAFVAELKRWLRFSPNTALRLGDGLFSAASGQPPLPEWLGPWLFDRAFSVKAETARYARQIASSGGIAVLAGAEADPAHWVQVGRACQRFALQATALGLTCSFLNQPVEVPEFRADLAALVGLPGRRPDIVLRFGRATPLPFSARRPLAAVLL